jgi:hypothetical protein
MGALSLRIVHPDQLAAVATILAALRSALEQQHVGVPIG